MNGRDSWNLQAELRDSALSMAAHGWHVFPCLPGRKQPALRVSWQEIATTDPARIRAWWHRIPYNIGVACGPSGLVVLDLDVPGHGDDQATANTATGSDHLADLCRQHDQRYPPDTLTVRTPSGGQHLIFRSPPDARILNAVGRPAPLIDVRGVGGYIIGFGSATAQGRYTTIRPMPPAPLPAWISKLLQPSDPPEAPTGARSINNASAYSSAALNYEAENVARAPEGTRNNTLFKAARNLGQLVAGNAISAADVRSVLTEVGTAAGLTSAEIARTVESGLRSGTRMPRGLPALSPAD